MIYHAGFPTGVENMWGLFKTWWWRWCWWVSGFQEVRWPQEGTCYEAPDDIQVEIDRNID